MNFKSKNYSHKAKDSCALRLLCAVIAHKDGAADIRGYVIRGDDAVVPARYKFIFFESAVDEREPAFGVMNPVQLVRQILKFFGSRLDSRKAVTAFHFLIPPSLYESWTYICAYVLPPASFFISRRRKSRISLLPIYGYALKSIPQVLSSKCEASTPTTRSSTIFPRTSPRAGMRFSRYQSSSLP